ncbi:MAG: hypothetical protein WCE54_18335 [Ignavibacteriaceae bacterium]
MINHKTLLETKNYVLVINGSTPSIKFAIDQTGKFKVIERVS